MTETRNPATRTSPYQGLRSFTEEDSDYFFGRDEERDVIIAHLKASRLTVIYGPSGVGKTSLLRAGVATELNRQSGINQTRTGTPEFIAVTFSEWRETPSVGLAEAIAGAATRMTGNVVEPLPSLAATIASAARAADATVLVILDQFEDLLAAQNAAPELKGFAEDFPRLIEDRSLRLNVLVSVRDDALARLDRFSTSLPWVLETRLQVRPLSDEAAERAIRGPLEEYNRHRPPDEEVTIDDKLVSAVIHEVRTGQIGFEPDDRPAARGRESLGNGPESLGNGHVPGRIETPYLQLVMAAVWDRELGEGSRRLRLDTLDDLGGARTIVRTHLDNVLGSLPADQKALAYQVFRQLVTPSGAKTTLRVSDLAEYSLQPVEQVQELVDRLARGEQRILRPLPAPPGDRGGPGVEIFHDVLVAAILAWRRGETAKRLQQEKAAAQDQARREQARARHERHRAQVFRAVAVAAMGLLAIAVVLGVYAEHQRAQADRARRVAESGQVAQEALGDLQKTSLAQGSLLSLAAYRIAPTPQARDDLMYSQEETQAMRAYFDGERGAVAGVAFSPDGRTLAAATASGTVVLRDVSTGRILRQLGGHTNFVQSVVFSPDGRRVASASSDGTVLVWRTASGARLLKLTRAGGLYGVAFSPDGRLLASAGTGRVVVLANALTGVPVRTLTGAGGTISGIAFNKGATLLAAASADHSIRVWDVATGRTVRVLHGHGAVTGVAFSPNGAFLADADVTGAILLWRFNSGRLARSWRASGPAQAVAFSPDGGTLAYASGDGISLGNVAAGTLTQSLRGQSSTVSSVVFGPDGHTVASGSYDGSVVLWELASPAAGVLHIGSPVYGVAFSSDGQRLAVGTASGASIWSLAAAAPAVTPQLSTGVVEGVAISPDERILAAAGQDGRLSVWDARSGRLRFRRSSGARSLHAVAFSPDGRTIAAAADDGHLDLWNARTGTPVRARQADGNPLYSVAFSPDGRTVAAAGASARVFIWNVDSTTLVHTLSAQIALIEGIAFSADGNEVAAASEDHTVTVWNARTGEPLGDSLRGHLNAATSVAFSRTSPLLVSGSADDTAIVWNLATRLGQPLGGHTAAVTTVAFGPKGNALAIASSDGTVAVFPQVRSLPSAAAIDARICAVVRRNLTRAEWRQFIPNESYQRLCAGYP